MRKLWAILFAFALVIAACGDDGDDGAGEDVGTEETSETTAEDADDQVQVRDVTAEEAQVAGETRPPPTGVPSRAAPSTTAGTPPSHRHGSTLRSTPRR
jgi:predicted small secreted protein